MCDTGFEYNFPTKHERLNPLDYTAISEPAAEPVPVAAEPVPVAAEPVPEPVAAVPVPEPVPVAELPPRPILEPISIPKLQYIAPKFPSDLNETAPAPAPAPPAPPPDSSSDISESSSKSSSETSDPQTQTLLQRVRKMISRFGEFFRN